MQRPPKPKKPKKGQPNAQTQTSRRDKWVIAAWIAGMLAIVLTIGLGSMMSKTAQHLDDTIDRWRTDYHLSPEQAERVRAMERKFHGTGNPFTLPAHTPEEATVHHREVAAAMNPADGERFLKAQEGGKKHP